MSAEAWTDGLSADDLIEWIRSLPTEPGVRR